MLDRAGSGHLLRVKKRQHCGQSDTLPITRDHLNGKLIHQSRGMVYGGNANQVVPCIARRCPNN